ncbi:MAG: glycosyltransferase family 4 protein [Candidatus Manganitrophus sp. SB1]|nr:glycosyltransferase family 4 protein [Candidatus Manganitrophus morganii]
MSSLFVFTENYVLGGGNRYLIDLVNGVSGLYKRVIIGSNAGGLFPADIHRLERPATVLAVKFLTASMVAYRLGKAPKLIRRFCLLPFILADPLLFFGNILVFLALLAKMKPSVVLCCNGGYPAARSTLAMAVAARWSRIPVVLSIVSMPAPRRLLVRFYDGLLDKLVWNSADLVIVNAQAILYSLQITHGMPLQKGRVIHNGIEDASSPGPATIKSNSDVIGCIARMDRGKGAIHLLDAFALLARKYASVELVMAGEGNASVELARRVCSMGLQNRVRLLGRYQGDVNKLLRSFDIYAFPSLWEGFPYSIIEAMHAGCAIVTTNVGGIPEALADGREGLLVEPGSSEALFEAMDRLLADKNFRETLGRNARAKYERTFSLDVMRKRVREVFIASGLAPCAFNTAGEVTN